MTTSPSIQNAIGIITDALKNAGKIRAGDDPDGNTIAEYMRKLNKLINYFMTKGCKLFLIEQVTLTLVPPLGNGNGVPLYTLGPGGTVQMQKPLRVISAYYVYNNTNGNNSQYPLTCLSYPNEYQSLSNVLSPGAVNSYAVDKQAQTLNVYLWNPPDVFSAANGSVLLLAQVSVQNFNGVTDNMTFPIEWSLALEWGLSDLASVGQPAMIQARCAAEAKKYKDELEDWDVEDADTEFQPDQRSFQNQGRFK